MSDDHNSIEDFFKKLYGLFLWIGFNCLKATEAPRGDSLLFTTKSLEVRGAHFIDLERMKNWVYLRNVRN